MGRYTDINRGPELNDAYEKYQTWLKKSRTQKQTDYKSVAKPVADRVKVERTLGYILPFNSENEKIYVEARVISATQTGAGSSTANTLRGIIDDRVETVLPTAADVYGIGIPRFRFAKIMATERTTTATADSESRITGTPYKRHRSNSCSSVFGRKSATDEYSAAIKEIRLNAAFKTFIASTGNTIGFTPEG